MPSCLHCLDANEVKIDRYEVSMNRPLIYIKKIAKGIIDWFDVNAVPALLAWKVSVSFLWHRTGKSHNLPALLIVSLTSYPARFGTLHLTLKSILLQNIAADHVILWISHKDKNALTSSVFDLQRKGLEIKYCDDLRSYKKIIPTLKVCQNNFIVTADDDVYYWPTWLDELVKTYNIGSSDVICHRIHNIRLGQDCLPLPYMQWDMEIQSTESSRLNFQTGVGGVLYPPQAFNKEVLNVEAFNRLCPQADDVWLYWMIRLNGLVVRRVPQTHRLYTWPDTQKTALFHDNVAGGGNDDQVRAMVNFYGFPN